MAVSAARGQWADLVNRACGSDEPVYLTHQGRRVAVTLSADAYGRLVDAADDADDRAALNSARSQGIYVSWGRVKKDLELG